MRIKLNRQSIFTLVVVTILLFATSSCIFLEESDGSSEVSSYPEVDGLFYDDSKRYVTKTYDVEGTFVDGISFNKMDIIIITDSDPVDSNSGVLRVIVYNDSNIVYADETEIMVDGEEVYIRDGAEWVKLEALSINAIFLPAIAYGISALLAALLTPSAISVIVGILGVSIVIITYDDLKEKLVSEVEKLFPDDNPSDITTEYSLPGDITIFYINDIPMMMHYGETDEASNFKDFETEVRSKLDQNSYYLVCEVDDVLAISPIAFGIEIADDIIELDMPTFHVWTLSAYKAQDIVGNAECHMFPFEIIACDTHFGHWHNCEYSLGVYYYSNSMALFGLEFNAQDDDTYLDEEDL